MMEKSEGGERGTKLGKGEQKVSVLKGENNMDLSETAERKL